MAYEEYKVRQGDSISSIAYEHGLFPDTVWDDQKNNELKHQRKNPNVLMPGDIVHLREQEEKEESCATEQKHKFRRKGVPAKLEIQLMEDDEPRANLEYTLELDGHLIKGKTNGDGKIKHDLSPGIKKAIIHIGETEQIPVYIGQIDPVTEITGVQDRLNNLGFSCPESGQLDEDTKAAIRAFQQEHDMDVTGEPDKKTQDKLQEIHGC